MLTRDSRHLSPSSANIQLKNIKTGKLYDIAGLPSNLRASSIQWSPDQKKFAFIHTSFNAVDLYVVDINTRIARKVNEHPLNTVLGESFQWAGNDQLVYKITADIPLEEMALAPSGPVVQENIGKAAANKTLSDNRANSVMNALVAKGIEKSRLSAKGWGQEKPLEDNSTEEGRAKCEER